MDAAQSGTHQQVNLTGEMANEMKVEPYELWPPFCPFFPPKLPLIIGSLQTASRNPYKKKTRHWKPNFGKKIDWWSRQNGQSRQNGHEWINSKWWLSDLTMLDIVSLDNGSVDRHHFLVANHPLGLNNWCLNWDRHLHVLAGKKNSDNCAPDRWSWIQMRKAGYFPKSIPASPSKHMWLFLMTHFIKLQKAPKLSGHSGQIKRHTCTTHIFLWFEYKKRFPLPCSFVGCDINSWITLQ